MKMPLHDLIGVLIELIFCLCDGGGERIFVRHIGGKLKSFCVYRCFTETYQNRLTENRQLLLTVARDSFWQEKPS